MASRRRSLAASPNYALTFTPGQFVIQPATGRQDEVFDSFGPVIDPDLLLIAPLPAAPHPTPSCADASGAGVNCIYPANIGFSSNITISGL